MKSPLIITLFLAVVVLWSGCKKDSSPTSPSSGGVVMQLKIGNSWKYQGTTLDSNGVVTAVDTSMFTILKDTVIGTETWYFIDSFELLTNRSDGLWYAVVTPSITPALFAKYPANVGDTWFSSRGQRATVVAKNVSVTVPAGTYSCIAYVFSDSTTAHLSANRYFPMDAGFVRDEFYSTTLAGRSYISNRRDLIAITLNKKAGEAAVGTQTGKGELFFGRP